MAAFEYVAVDPNGKRMSGVISADTGQAARRELRVRQLTPIKVDPIRSDSSSGAAGHSIKLKDKDRAVLTRQLAVLLQSGMQIDQAISAIAGEENNPSTRKLLANIHSQISEGKRFADALETAPRAFPPLYQAISAAGEQSGRLDEVMGHLAGYLESSYRVRRKVQSALVYPFVLALLAFGMVGALMIIVVPRLVEQFDVFGGTLPWLTRQVIGVSNFLQGIGGIVVLLLIVSIPFVFRYLKRGPSGQLIDRMLLKLPVAGRMITTVQSARFARVFATLSSSGGTVLESLGAAGKAMTNQVFAKAADEIIVKVREGGSFASALKATQVFPPVMVQMISMGEQGRNLSLMMNRSAELLEEEFENSTSTMLSLMEPLIIIVMGGLVALIVLAIMLPIIQLNTLVIG